MRKLKSLFLIGLLVMGAAVGATAAGDDTGSAAYCADDEHAVFYGSSGETIAAVCVPDGKPDAGYYLVFYFERPDGTTYRLKSALAGAGVAAAGQYHVEEGSSYAYVRFRDGARDYVIYSGTGRYAANEGNAEPVDRAGLVIIENGQAVEIIDLTVDFTSELGSELFSEIKLPDDPNGFELPMASLPDEPAEAMDKLMGILAERFTDINGAGHRGRLIWDGESEVNGQTMQTFSFGDSTEEKFIALDRYAVADDGTVYQMRVAEGDEYERIFPTLERERRAKANFTLSIDLAWPEFGRPDLDGKIQARAEKLVSGCLKEIDGGFLMSDPDNAYDFGLDYQTTRSSAGAVSVIFNGYAYAKGAAHPNGFVETMNLSTGSGEELTLDKLFRDPEKALAVFAKLSPGLILDSLRQESPDVLESLGDPDDIWLSREGFAPTLENYQALALEPEGVRVFFQSYQVLAYAFGRPEVLVPLAALAAAGPNREIWPEPAESPETPAAANSEDGVPSWRGEYR